MFYSDTMYRTAEQVNSAMGRVYNQMVLAIINSMVVSFLVASTPSLMQLLFATPLKWVVIFAPLAAVLAITFLMDKMNKTHATFALHGFAALMGLSFSTIFVVYTMGSIASAFFGASILFVCMSVYGYFTKRSLESFGQFLFIGLIAIVIASIINIFVGSTVAQMVISAIAVLIFTGLTAYDTQKIREMISIENDGKAEVMGALTLYLDFINIFLNLLQLFGNKE
jgi:FtsH-binding integral membrane protein